MKTILIVSSLIILISQSSILNSTIWEIKQDGTGDFTTITEGINAAIGGDTVLVYPGTYYENLEIREEKIVLTSLYGIESDDRRYIRETVIDGDLNGRPVVIIWEHETNGTVLNGFTIQNGLCTNGGGIFIRRSSPTITNCHIKNNIARDSGGGMNIAYSSAVVKNCIIEYNLASRSGGISHDRGNAFFAGNTIRHNRAMDANGGFRAWGALLCDVSLNSIYLNYAGSTVNDLSLRDMTQQSVVVDTFTVLEPDPHSQYLITWLQALEAGTYDFTALNSKIVPVAADLYVATNGCNFNSGLTPGEPLQTIAYAMSRIKADGPERKNIFVADGIYSHSLNNQAFPMQVLSNVNIIGERKENTIIDLEHNGWAFSALVANMVATSGPDQRYKSNFSIKNLTIKNGGQNEDIFTHMNSGIRFNSVQDYELENIDFTGSAGHDGRGNIFSSYGANFLWKNLNLYDNVGPLGLFLLICGGGVSDTLRFHMENIRINSHKYAAQIGAGSGRSMYTYVMHSAEKPVEGTIVNLEITDGELGNIDPFWGDYPYSHFQYQSDINEYERRLRIVNATIGNNTAVGRIHGGGMLFIGHVEAEIINSIIYGNRPDNLTIYNPENHQMDIHFIHSILEGGLNNVKYYGNANANIHWREGSMDIDPLWIGENELGINPYMLSDNSRARGAGTVDIPGFEFPEYDLAGNPRIVDGQIDMGAYQWQPATSVDDDVGTGYHTVRPDYNLRNFPNPAVTLLNHSTVGVDGYRSSTTGTNIAFKLPESGNVMIEIYNLKGQFVRRVFDAHIPKGEHNVFWDGRDERGRYVATGFYMYNLHINDRLAATGRATFIK